MNSYFRKRTGLKYLHVLISALVLLSPSSALLNKGGGGVDKHVQPTLKTIPPSSSRTQQPPSLIASFDVFKNIFRGGGGGGGVSTITAPTTCTPAVLNILEGVKVVAAAYSDALVNRPTATKGCTGFVMCGLGDILAQVRGFKARTKLLDAETTILFTLDYLRLARFATRGFIGTLIWSFWYDYTNNLYSDEDIARMLVEIGIRDELKTGDDNAAKRTINAFRVFILMTLEQFVACPIVYSLWDIPVATMLNGASLSKIPHEITDKLLPMLINNFKVWTPANMFLYSAPVHFRPLIANLVGILWQSIMAEFSADCGK